MKKNSEERPKSSGFTVLKPDFVVTDSVDHRRKVLFTECDQKRLEAVIKATPSPVMTRSTVLSPLKKESKSKGKKQQNNKDPFFFFKPKGSASDNGSIHSNRSHKSKDTETSQLQNNVIDLKKFFGSQLDADKFSQRLIRQISTNTTQKHEREDFKQVFELIKINFLKNMTDNKKSPQLFFKKGPKLPPLPSTSEAKNHNREYKPYKEPVKFKNKK